ncbi:MAG: hypothetical protein ACT4RN_22375 [Pseudonocardia sp.]
MSRFARRALTVAALTATTAATLTFAATPAFALGPTTVAKSGNILTVTAAPGSDNHIRIGEDATGFFVRDLRGVRPAAGSGCVNENGTGQARCARTGITQVIVNTGDFDDNVGIGAPAGSQVRYEVRSGTGNDAVSADTPATTLRGEAGDDYLANTSSQFPAVLDGGAGTDRCPVGRAVRDTRIGCELT